MREIERKASDKLKDFISRLGKGVKDAEGEMSGQIGRAANKMASGVESMAERLKPKPKPQTSGPAYSQEDLDKAMEIWKTQGMGKIGNQPTGKPYSMGGDMGKYEFFGQFNDKRKPKGDYVTKPSDDGGVVNDPYTAMKYTEMSKKILKQNLVEGRKPYSSGEKNTGRAIIGTGYAGGVVGEAINYAMDENEAERKKRSEPNHFMSKEITSQQDAHNSWSKKKYGNQ